MPPIRLAVERLEARDTPASTITVVPGLAGSGSLDGFLTGSGGVVAAGNGGNVPGTLSTGALASIPAANNISVTAQSSITFNDLAPQGGTLALTTGAGRTASFTAGGSGSLTFVNPPANTLSTAGGSLTFVAGSNIVSGQLTTGGGNITMTATGGSLAQSGTANAGTGTIDFTAAGAITVDALNGGTVILTSIGGSIASVPGVALVTASTQLRLASATGIELRTQTPFLQQAIADDSGDITVVNTGSLTTGPVTVRGAAEVSISAPSNGATLTLQADVLSVTGDITLSGADGLTMGVGGGAATSGTGTITLVGDGNADGIGAYAQFGAGVSSGGGTVTVRAADVDLSGAISAGAGAVLVQPSTFGRPIDLGTNAPGALGLTDAELDIITAGAVRVGSLAAGPVVVSAAITPAATTTLTLLTSAGVSETGSITVANLRVNATGAVTLTGANNVGRVAGVAAGGFVLNNVTNPLIVGTVDNSPGLSSANNPIRLIADAIDVQQLINAGTAVVTVEPFTTALPITVGGGATGLGITDAELNRITAGVLRIGNTAGTGTLTVDGTVTRHAGFNALDLITGNTSASAVSQAAPLSVANLAVQAPGGGVALTNAGNDVDALAASVGQSFGYRDGSAVVVGTVDGVTGLSAPGGTIGLNVNGPVTQAAGAVTASGLLLLGAGPVALTNPANNVGVLAANLPAGLAYTNAGSLATGSLSLAGVGSASGLTTSDAPLAVTAVTGTLILTAANPIAAGPGGTVTLTGSVALGGNTAITAASTAFAATSAVSAVQGNTFDLAVGGNATFGTPVAGVGNLSVGGSTVLNAPSITTVGGQSYQGGLALARDVSLTAATAAISGPYAGGSFVANVVGGVSLTGATLEPPPAGSLPPGGAPVVLIANDGTDAVSGQFGNAPEGTAVNIGGILYQVSYQGGTGNDVTLTRLNTPPVAAADTVTAFADRPVSVAVLANDADADGDALTVTAVTQGAHGAVTFTPGGVTYTPAAGYTGPDSFTYTISDGNGGTATASVSVAVAVIDAPLAVGGPEDGTVAVFVPAADGQYGSTPIASLSPFTGFAGQVRTATGDVDHDGVPDAVLVTGPGTPVRVAVVSGADNSTVLVPPFDPFGGDFTGGGFVAAADLDGDGFAEFAVTPDQGGGPRVTIFSLVGTDAVGVRANFFAIDDDNFRGGARPALGDVNADGKPDLLVAAGFGGGPRVALFDGAAVLGNRTKLANDFFAFPEDAQTLRNGVFAALGDVSGDGFADLIFGGGPGGGPRVYILSGQLLMTGSATLFSQPVANFFVAGNGADRGGVRLAVKDADGDNKADVFAGSGEGSPANVRVYLGKDFTSSGEPETFQDLSVFGGGVLPGGVFVG